MGGHRPRLCVNEEGRVIPIYWDDDGEYVFDEDDIFEMREACRVLSFSDDEEEEDEEMKDLVQMITDVLSADEEDDDDYDKGKKRGREEEEDVTVMSKKLRDDDIHAAKPTTSHNYGVAVDIVVGQKKKRIRLATKREFILRSMVDIGLSPNGPLGFI